MRSLDETTTGGFDADFLAYGAHFQALEQARDSFRRQRDALLDRLADRPERSPAFSSRKMKQAKRANGGVEFSVESAYARVRSELSLPSFSGFSLLLRPYGDDAFAGFQTVAYFAMSAKAASVVDRILGVEAVLHGLQFSRVFHEQVALNVRFAAIPFDSPGFTPERLEAAAEALPGQFLALEQRVVAAHQQLRELE